jgi:hypothetical protein
MVCSKRPVSGSGATVRKHSYSVSHMNQRKDTRCLQCLVRNPVYKCSEMSNLNLRTFAVP